jgi:hypothetical protein
VLHGGTFPSLAGHADPRFVDCHVDDVDVVDWWLFLPPLIRRRQFSAPRDSVMRFLVASLVTAVALFLFGFLWWGVLMPIVRPVSVITDQALVEKMSSSLNESGIYFYPDPATEPGESAGPMAILYFNSESPQMGPMMGIGFAHMFLTALLVSMFVSSRKLPSYSDRLKFVFCLGLLIALWADVGNMIWWRHPPGWTAFHFGYDVLSWLLAGSIIAAMVKPYAERPGSEE